MTFSLHPSTAGHAFVRSSTGLRTIDLPIVEARRVLTTLRLSTSPMSVAPVARRVLVSR